MKYGYIRVSSKSQKDNYSIKEQHDLVLAAGAKQVENMPERTTLIIKKVVLKSSIGTKSISHWNC